MKSVDGRSKVARLFTEHSTTVDNAKSHIPQTRRERAACPVIIWRGCCAPYRLSTISPENNAPPYS
jgi:hypothetical protein